MNEEKLLEVRNLSKHFEAHRRRLWGKRAVVKAVDGVSFSVYKGETLGLVGESGCGKSTLGRMLLRLIQPSGGSVVYRGQDLSLLNDEQMRQMRRKLQIIFQDPYASLNPRMTVFEIIKQPLDAFDIGTRQEREEKVRQVMQRVGLREDWVNRFPHEFSGGQRQRIVIARALMLDPEFIVCDEPVSALDVSVRSQVLNLMKQLQREMDLTYLFISHDLSVVRYLSDRVAVMYLGQIIELAETRALYENPLHPYTEALLASIPVPDTEAVIRPVALQGEVPSAVNVPSGCRFHTRCSYCMSECASRSPELIEYEPGHSVACHRFTAQNRPREVIEA